MGPIANLNVFEVEGFLAVFAVERPLRTLALVVALLLVEADVFFTGGAGDDHELALALVAELEGAERQLRSKLSAPHPPMTGADLVLLNGSFPGAVFVDAHGRKVFNLPSNGVVGKSLNPPPGKTKAALTRLLITCASAHCRDVTVV